jgi:hypothetical protein
VIHRDSGINSSCRVREALVVSLSYQRVNPYCYSSICLYSTACSSIYLVQREPKPPHAATTEPATN